MGRIRGVCDQRRVRWILDKVGRPPTAIVAHLGFPKRLILVLMSIVFFPSVAERLFWYFSEFNLGNINQT